MEKKEFKELRENSVSGIKTMEFKRELLHQIVDFNEKVFGMSLENTQDDIRDFKFNKKGNPTFKCGGGYDVIDVDLLGGNGTGELKRMFERYEDIKKEKDIEIKNNKIEYFKERLDYILDKEPKYLPKDKLDYLLENREKVKGNLEKFKEKEIDGWDKFGKKDKEMER